MIKNILDDNKQFEKLCEILQNGIFSKEHAVIVKILHNSLSNDVQRKEIQQKIDELILTKDIMDLLKL